VNPTVTDLCDFKSGKNYAFREKCKCGPAKYLNSIGTACLDACKASEYQSKYIQDYTKLTTTYT